MRCRQILGLVAVFLAMSGSMLGSEPEKRRQFRWSEFKKLIGGKKVALQFAQGARVEGRVRKLTDTSLVFKVKKSSEPAAYPKGKIQIPRETVSQIEVRGLKENKGKRVGATVGTAAGMLFGSVVAFKGGKLHEGSSKVVLPSGAIATVAAVFVYRALAPKDITILEILPDSPGERMPKPTNKEQSLNTTASGEALAALTQ